MLIRSQAYTVLKPFDRVRTIAIIVSLGLFSVRKTPTTITVY